MTVSKLIKELEKIKKKHGPRIKVTAERSTMKKLTFTHKDLENFNVFHIVVSHDGISKVRGEPELLELLNVKFEEWFKDNEPLLMTIGEYGFSRGVDEKKKPFLWMSKDDGEAMGLSIKELDKIWKDNF